MDFEGSFENYGLKFSRQDGVNTEFFKVRKSRLGGRNLPACNQNLHFREGFACNSVKIYVKLGETAISSVSHEGTSPVTH